MGKFLEQILFWVRYFRSPRKLTFFTETLFYWKILTSKKDKNCSCLDTTYWYKSFVQTSRQHFWYVTKTCRARWTIILLRSAIQLCVTSHPSLSCRYWDRWNTPNHPSQLKQTAAFLFFTLILNSYLCRLCKHYLETQQKFPTRKKKKSVINENVLVCLGNWPSELM